MAGGDKGEEMGLLPEADAVLAVVVMDSDDGTDGVTVAVVRAGDSEIKQTKIIFSTHSFTGYRMKIRDNFLPIHMNIAATKMIIF